VSGSNNALCLRSTVLSTLRSDPNQGRQRFRFVLLGFSKLLTPYRQSCILFAGAEGRMVGDALSTTQRQSRFPHAAGGTCLCTACDRVGTTFSTAGPLRTGQGYFAGNHQRMW
jgi:hypothetical protein